MAPNGFHRRRWNGASWRVTCDDSPAMTARISSREITPGHWEISVAGQLADEGVDALEMTLVGLGPGLVLNLSELRGLDGRAEALLRRLKDAGAIIRGQSPFISLVLSLDPEAGT